MVESSESVFCFGLDHYFRKWISSLIRWIYQHICWVYVRRYYTDLKSTLLRLFNSDFNLEAYLRRYIYRDFNNFHWKNWIYKWDSIKLVLSLDGLRLSFKSRWSLGLKTNFLLQFYPEKVICLNLKLLKNTIKAFFLKQREYGLNCCLISVVKESFKYPKFSINNQFLIQLGLFPIASLSIKTPLAQRFQHYLYFHDIW